MKNEDKAIKIAVKTALAFGGISSAIVFKAMDDIQNSQPKL
jgi:hypothetical protein